MLHTPDRFERGRVVREAGNKVPMDVGKLVAKQFVVDLAGLVDLAERIRYQIHFLD